MLGKLNTIDIEEVLNQEFIGRIGCHADGVTYIVPISYAYKDECIYGRTKEGMKVTMMRKNPKVCFEVAVMKDTANWKSVIAWGEFEELTENTERDKALRHLTDRALPLISSETTHLSPDWPFPLKNISSIEGIVFRIRLNEKTGRFESNEFSNDLLPG
jgi:uncharacterized protein